MSCNKSDKIQRNGIWSQKILPLVKSSLNIVINDSALEKVDRVRSLGVVLESDLGFLGHVNSLLQRAYSTLKLIYGHRQLLPVKTKILLCESLVLSVFNYADVLYDSFITAVYKRKIQKLQNSCLRLIYGIKRNERISYKLNEVGWLNMQSRRLHHSACLYHKVVVTTMPAYLYRKIQFRTDIHNLNLRFKGLLTPPIHVTEFFKRSFSYRIGSVYNGIDFRLKQLAPVSFRTAYKRFLFERQIL